jgi:two-component system sensor histidine kinase UhpB
LSDTCAGSGIVSSDAGEGSARLDGAAERCEFMVRSGDQRAGAAHARPLSASFGGVDAETLFRRIADRTPMMIWTADAAGRYTFLNRARLRFTGRSLDAEVGDGWIESVHPEDRSGCLQSHDQAVRTGAPFTAEYRLRRADGCYRWVLHHGQPWRLAGKPGFVGSCIDFTERKDEEERFRARLRELADRAEAAREEERSAVAREIHDELGQTLTALKMEIGRAIPFISRGPAVDRLQSMVGLCELAIQAVQRIASQLRSPVLDHLGLAEAVSWEAAAFRARTGIRCRVAAARDTTALSPDQQLVVFRILQEALTNVARHAGASAVSIRIREDRTRFELLVRDNGRGISPDELARAESFGVLGMRERAAAIGGALTIGGRPGRGTHVVVQVPLARGARRRG